MLAGVPLATSWITLTNYNASGGCSAAGQRRIAASYVTMDGSHYVFKEQVRNTCTLLKYQRAQVVVLPISMIRILATIRCCRRPLASLRAY